MHIQIHNTNIYNTDRVKQKIKQRKDTPEKLRPMSLGLNTNNNYVIAKTIARYFDNIFIDTDSCNIIA